MSFLTCWQIPLQKKNRFSRKQNQPHPNRTLSGAADFEADSDPQAESIEELRPD